MIDSKRATMKRLRALALGLLAIPLLAHDGMAGTAAAPPPPGAVIHVGTYTTCTSTVCNCTSSTITSTFCHEEQFGFEVGGGEILTVKTGKKSSQCDQVPVLPGKCVSQCYSFEVWKSCGILWDTYTSKQVGTIYEEYPATCSVVLEIGARPALRARLAS